MLMLRCFLQSQLKTSLSWFMQLFQPLLPFLLVHVNSFTPRFKPLMLGYLGPEGRWEVFMTQCCWRGVGRSGSFSSPEGFTSTARVAQQPAHSPDIALHSSEGLPFHSASSRSEFGQVIVAVDCDGFVGMCSCIPRLHSTLKSHQCINYCCWICISCSKYK